MSLPQAYIHLIQKYIHPGRMWAGSRFQKLVGALGKEFGRIEEALESLKLQRNITQVDTMLEEYEAEYFEEPYSDGTIEQRKARLIEKATVKNNASRPKVEAIINAYGYSVLSWNRYTPSRALQMRCGESIIHYGCIYYLRIQLDPPPAFDENYNQMIAALDLIKHANMAFIFE